MSAEAVKDIEQEEELDFGPVHELLGGLEEKKGKTDEIVEEVIRTRIVNIQDCDWRGSAMARLRRTDSLPSKRLRASGLVVLPR